MSAGGAGERHNHFRKRHERRGGEGEGGTRCGWGATWGRLAAPARTLRSRPPTGRDAVLYAGVGWGFNSSCLLAHWTGFSLWRTAGGSGRLGGDGRATCSRAICRRAMSRQVIYRGGWHISGSGQGGRDTHQDKSDPVVFTVVFCVFGAGGPREDSLCGLRYSSVHHREVGVSRSDLRRAQGQTARAWPLRVAAG